MAKQEIERQFKGNNVSILNGVALSEAIDVGGFTVGMITIPSAWTAANVGFKVCSTEDGTYVILNDTSGVPAQIENIDTALAGAYEIPTEAYSARFMKLWSKSAVAATTTDVNQGADRAITVMLKA